MGLKDHGLDAQQGVSLHLLEFARCRDDFTSPRDVTQPGIASRLSIPRGYISYLLKKMETEDLVIRKLGHVKDEKRKKKVFYLSDSGYELASDLLKTFDHQNFDFIFKGEPYHMAMSGVRELTGFSEMDILLRTGNDPGTEIDRAEVIEIEGDRSSTDPWTPKVNCNFVGRSEEIKKALDWFEKKRGTLIVTGLAGEGKTEFCLNLLCQKEIGDRIVIYHKVKGWDPVPYLISDLAIQLSKYGRSSLSDLICEKGNLKMNDLVGILRSEMEQGRILLALDDIQEIEEVGSRKNVIEPLFDLSREGLGLILLSRTPVGLEDPRNSVLRSDILNIKLGSLEKDDVERFMENEYVDTDLDIYDISRGHPLCMRLLVHYIKEKMSVQARIDIEEFIRKEVLARLNDTERNLVDILSIDRLGLEGGKILELDAGDIIFSKEDVRTMLSSSILFQNHGRTSVHDLIGSINMELMSRRRRDRIHGVLSEHYLEEYSKFDSPGCGPCSEDIVTRANMLKEMFHHRKGISEDGEMMDLISEFGEKLVSISDTDLIVELTEHLVTSDGSIPQDVQPRSFTRTIVFNGWSHATKGDWDTAMERYEKALSISKEHGLKNMVGRCENAIGSLYLRRGDLYRSQKHISRSLELLVTDLDRSKALSNLAVVNWQLGDLDIALEHIDSSLGISRKLSDEMGIARALNNKGIILLQKGELSSSLNSFEKALSICRLNRFIQTESTIEDNLGEVTLKMGEKNIARDHFNNSLNIASKIGFKWQIAQAMKNLGMLENDVSERRGKLKKARDIYFKLGAQKEVEDIDLILN